MARWILLSTILGLSLTMAFASLPLSPVHAITHRGSVCLSPFTFSCPTSPPVFEGAPGSKIRVNVVVQNADSFDGFTVWVGADPSAIKAVNVDLTNSVLLGASAHTGCINDCTYWLSGGPGAVAEYADGGQPTSAPTTGLLFSIVYQVVGNSNNASIGLYFTVSPSGWVADGVYLHFTGGCDTMECFFVHVTNATFKVAKDTWPPLLASFSLETRDGQIKGQSNVSGGRFPYAYNWAFGDGLQSYEPNPTHNYTSAGTYMITLVVQDSVGNQQILTRRAYVIQPPRIQPPPSTQPPKVLWVPSYVEFAVLIFGACAVGACCIMLVAEYTVRRTQRNQESSVLPASRDTSQ